MRLGRPTASEHKGTLPRENRCGIQSYRCRTGQKAGCAECAQQAQTSHLDLVE
ncbi:hypothetical protein IV72_GL000560 [Atopobium minutum]|nr:hypothetical protein IV72_GL000560 [Atopobium minutum]